MFGFSIISLFQFLSQTLHQHLIHYYLRVPLKVLLPPSPSLSLSRSFGVVFNAKQTLDNLSNLSQRILLFHNVHCLSL